MDLSDVSNKKLIKEFKSNPTDSSYIAELYVRLDSGDISDADFIGLIDVLFTIRNGG